MLTKDAMLYETLQDRAVHCYLCSHHCRAEEGDSGTLFKNSVTYVSIE